MRKLIAGNWKMNGLAASLAEAAADRWRALPSDGAAPTSCICPPATLIAQMRWATRGSPAPDRRAGLPCQGLGRPYRRHLRRDAGRCRRDLRHRRPFRAPRRPWRDRRDWCAPRPRPPWRAGLIAIICVGETEAEREAGQTLERAWPASSPARCPDGASAADIVVAYEPVWAIGTG